jgi:uncharacterized protein (TIGR03790 family)
MAHPGLRTFLAAAVLLVFGIVPSKVRAGGSGLNTVVVINKSSSNSCEVGNYFCERRQVPPENVLYINWNGGNVSWTNTDFQNTLLDSLFSMLAQRQLTNQIDYVVLSMDIPFQTLNGPNVNSTTSALFYGLQNDSGPNAAGIVNTYARSEQIFRQAPPASSSGASFLTTMLTADTVATVKQMIDRGVSSDGTRPTQPVLLAKSSDYYRNGRYVNFDNAIFNTRLCANYQVLRTNLDSPLGLTDLLGFETGLANFSISPGTFVPGAITDSLTSFGGIIFQSPSQTTLLAFIAAGATGAYGTVVEPSPSLEKFPNPQVYFYQARGFSLAECYYQSIDEPYEGLIVGEPLAAPFQHVGSGAWLSPASNGLLSGTAQLSLQFQAADATHPLQQVDLFVDGKYWQTLTNIPPQPGNALTFTLNNQQVTYTIPANSTLASVASGLTTQLNNAGSGATTNVIASTFGDRIELHSVSTHRPASPSNVHSQGKGGSASSGNSPPSFGSSKGSANSLTTLADSARGMFLNSQAYGLQSYFVNGAIQAGSWLRLSVVKTNGAAVTLSVTNQSSTATFYDLATQLTNAINTSAALSGADGLSADDLLQGYSGTALFNLRARGAGLKPALMNVTLSGSPMFTINPAGQVALTNNLSDLVARNLLYIRAGLTNLGLTFALDTTTLANGYHQLDAVAYEGTHVHTQTRASVPVIVQNSSLNATMTLMDLPNPSPVHGTYHIQVTANTNTVSTISLYTTGGKLSSLTNQSNPTFVVNGSSLGVGLHPFYALVQTSDGLQYRTQTQSVRLY